jgi:predicted transcriptional regulator
MSEELDNHPIALTADIVASYVTNNSVAAVELPKLIQSVHDAIVATGKPQSAPVAELVPAVNPKKSVQPDWIISLEDGKKYKSLKRHLATKGLTPDEYRAKWNLPKDYPMVAANYSAQRSNLAKTLGLGRKAAPAPVAAKPTAKAAKATAKVPPPVKAVAPPRPLPKGKNQGGGGAPPETHT